MKRWTDEHAEMIAKEFSRSDFAISWRMFGADVRRAILDSVIMDQMRIADSVDSAIQFTASEVVEFRNLVERKLADGVKRRSDVPIRFEVQP